MSNDEDPLEGIRIGILGIQNLKDRMGGKKYGWKYDEKYT